MKKYQVNKILLLLGCCLLFLMIAFPFIMYSVKSFLMVVLLFVSLNILLKRKNTFDKFVFRWCILYVFFGVFFSFVGYFSTPEQFDHTLKATTINILWPIFYMLLMALFSQGFYVIQSINRILIFSSIFVGIYIFLGGMSYLGFIGIPHSIFINTSLTEGKYDAVVQLSDPSITSLMYLIPYILSYFVLKINKIDNLKIYYVIVALSLTLIAMIISGRRALILNLFLAPVLLFIVVRFSKLKRDKKVVKIARKNFIGMAILLICTSIFMISFDLMNFDALQESFLQSFDLSENSKDISSEIRGDQIDGLLKSFKDNPIFGSGLGTGSKYVIRSYDVPGAYELSYLAILFQSGIVGFIMYIGLLLALCIKLFLLIDKEKIFIVPHLVGLISFLIANASNPYLGAFDHLWTLFLPVGIINYCLVKKE